MKGLPIVFICVCLLVFLAINNVQKNYKFEKNRKKIEKQMNLSGFENFKYNVVPLSQEAQLFLKSKDPYKNYFLANKKFVVYVEIKGCPYNGAFVASLNKYKNNVEYSSKYNFLSLPSTGFMRFASKAEYKGYKDFYDVCSGYCIVNPIKKQIFSIQEKEYDVLIKYMDRMFSQLQNW